MTKKLKAITLTETVVYIAIFSIFMVILIQFFLSVQVNQDKVYKELELEMNQIFISNHLEETLGHSSVFNSENNSFFNKQETLEYKILNGDLILEKDGVVTSLVNSKAVAQSISFEPIWAQEGIASAVKINVSLRHSGNERVTRDFSNLIKLAIHEE